ncbi:MAG: putative circularly permuted ATP-grasp superfamily protein, partial [Sulfurimonas sp.]
MSIFESYISESAFDEMHDSNNNIRENWEEIVKEIEDSGLDKLREKQAEIDWYLEDNGVTYNIYDDHDGPVNRSWSMDPIPLVIEEKEWNSITKGVEQRAKLFNLIFKDLYSDQKLLKDNIVPAEVIFSHKGFCSEVFNFGYKEDFNLYFYATDLARGPDGKMWVVSDKTQAPSGLGYAIENRLTMNSVTKDFYSKIERKKLFTFLEEYKALLTKLSGGDLSSVALLTPGPHNETYFEHAYLSSFLEIKMLQGEDLLVKNGALWLKKLGGLKKINTLLRRVDDTYCDPLELKNESQLGVPGLIEAMRQDKLNMMNPVGSAVVENVGLNPFMNKIAQYFLKEDLILPQIATWWCGQKSELDYVLANLDTLIIKKIDRTEKIKIYFGKKLSQVERQDLEKLLLENPHKYVAQEEVNFSTVPYYNNG